MPIDPTVLTVADEQCLANFRTYANHVRRAVGVREFAEWLEHAPGYVQQRLSKLVRHGELVQDARTRRYRLAPRR